MKKLKFPLIKQGQFHWPQGQNCPMCNKKLATKDKTEQVILSLGALRKEKKDCWIIDHNLGGFMTLATHTHGKTKMKHGYLNIVDMSLMGQADLTFCSTNCLREFFMAITNALEDRMKKNE